MPPKRKRVRLSKKGKVTKKSKTSNKDACIQEAITHVRDKDWRIGKCLKESMRAMFTEQISCDIHFLCGETKERVSAHKFVLFCRSSVFFAMFEGPAADGNEDILVPDIDVAIMKNFLRYLYCEDVELTDDTLMQMVYVSQKYQVHSLIEECTKFVSKILMVDNACMLMEMAHTFSDPKLQTILLEFIEDHAVDVLRSESIKDLCKDCLRMILNSDDLNVDWECPESWDTESGAGTLRTHSNHDDNISRSGDEGSYAEDEGSYTEDERSYTEDERSISDGDRSISEDARSEIEQEEEGDESFNENANDQGAQGDEQYEHGPSEEDVLPDPERNSQYLERAVFEGLLTWADAQCSRKNLEITGENRRSMVSELIPLVRYRLIDSDYFVKKVAQSGILTADERIKIIEYRLSPRLSRSPFWNCEKRGPHYHAWNFPRFKENSTSLSESISCNGIEAVSFFCYEDLFFHGFSVYGMCRPPSGDDVGVISVIGKIYDHNGTVLGKIDETVEDHWYSEDLENTDTDYTSNCRQTISTIEVYLKRKVALKKNCLYSLVVDLQGDIKTYYGVKGHQTLYDINHSSRKLLRFEDYNVVGYDGQTTATRGQIPVICLSKTKHYKDGSKL